jgi:hypothetical protein
VHAYITAGRCGDFFFNSLRFLHAPLSSQTQTHCPPPIALSQQLRRMHPCARARECPPPPSTRTGRDGRGQKGSSVGDEPQREHAAGESQLARARHHVPWRGLRAPVLEHEQEGSCMKIY